MGRFVLHWPTKKPPAQFSVSPRFWVWDFGAKGLGPGLDNFVLFVSPTIWRWVVLEAVENLGGPALTSHLNTPLVSEAALLRMM